MKPSSGTLDDGIQTGAQAAVATPSGALTNPPVVIARSRTPGGARDQPPERSGKF